MKNVYKFLLAICVALMAAFVGACASRPDTYQVKAWDLILCYDAEAEYAETKEITVLPYKNDVAMDGASLQYTVTKTGGDDCVSIDGTSVTATAKGEATLTVSATIAGNTVSDELTVSVKGLYDESVDFSDFYTCDMFTTLTESLDPNPATAYDDVLKCTMGEYQTATEIKNETGWSAWNHRIMSSAFDDFETVHNKGYRYVTYDVYFPSSAFEQKPSDMPFNYTIYTSLGVDCTKFFVPNEEFNSDWLQVAQDGVITNRFRLDEWNTILLDFENQIIKGETSSFIAIMGYWPKSEFYLRNLRYYYTNAEFLYEEAGWNPEMDLSEASFLYYDYERYAKLDEHEGVQNVYKYDLSNMAGEKRLTYSGAFKEGRGTEYKTLTVQMYVEGQGTFGFALGNKVYAPNILDANGKSHIYKYEMDTGEYIGGNGFPLNKWITVRLDLQNLPLGSTSAFSLMSWGDVTGIYVKSVTFSNDEIVPGDEFNPEMELAFVDSFNGGTKQKGYYSQVAEYDGVQNVYKYDFSKTEYPSSGYFLGYGGVFTEAVLQKYTTVKIVMHITGAGTYGFNIGGIVYTPVQCKDFIKVYGLKDGAPLSQDGYIFDEWIVVELDLKNLPTDGTHSHFTIMKWGAETTGGLYLKSIVFSSATTEGGSGEDDGGNQGGSTWEGVEI